MKFLSFLLLFVSISICFVTTATFARDEVNHSRKAEIRRAIADAYHDARTYYDQGMVRAVQVRAREAFARNADPAYDTLQERIILFETAYDRSEGFRAIVTAAEGFELDFSTKVFLRTENSYSVRRRGNDESMSSDSFMPLLMRELSFHEMLANEVVTLLEEHSNMYPFLQTNPYIEEVRFGGRPAYRLVGRTAGEVTSWWVDKETHLLMAAERVQIQSPRVMTIVTTVYKPERNARVSRANFTLSASGLPHNPDEWKMPRLDVRGAIARDQWWPGASPPAAQVAPDGATDETDPEESPAEPSVLTQELSAEEMESIVLIEGETGQGSGFICRINDLSFVITNLHVLADTENLRIRNSRGDLLRPRAIHAARGHDVALIRIDDVTGGLKMAEDAGESEIGDEVVVVGNRLGGGVMTQEAGQVLGVGPERVEVDAKFQPGNSGSPIINTASGEVIGVATYLQEVSIMGEGRASADGTPSREVSTRWFGYRFDSIEE